MLHLVETLDGHASRRCYQVDGSLWVQTAGFEQFYSSFHSLHHDLLGIISLEAQLHAALCSCTDVAHGVGDTTRGERGTCCQVLLVCNQGVTHLVEDANHRLRLLLRGIDGHDKRHRCHLGNGDVGYCQEQRGTVLTQPFLNAC